MRVMVTGATGFVGGHTAAALIRAGHEVTALVRDERRLRSTMATLGVDAPDAVVGDMTDPTAVAAATEGAAAVVHCAAVVSLDSRRSREMLDANVTGLRNVLEAAAHSDILVVHTSSISALFRPRTGVLTPDMPVATARYAYGSAKAACEELAREYQERGAPVVITYPSGILGPPAGHALGETAAGMSKFVSGGVMPTRRAALSWIDVRDLAAANVAIVEGAVDGDGPAPRRVMCGGHLVTMDDLALMLRELTGRRVPVPPTPPGALRATGRALDLLRRYVPFDTAMTAEAMTLVTRWEGSDDSSLAQLGIHPRDARATLEVSLRAWVDEGLLPARKAGRLVATPTEGQSRRLADRVRGARMPARVLASKPFRAIAPQVFPRFHRAALRLSGGRTMLDTDAQPMLMLTATGARSGEPRRTPLATVPRPDGSFVVVGSNFARDTHPTWTSNLLAHPDASVTFRGKEYAVRAHLITAAERAALWPDLVAVYPNWDDYGEITDREFRVFRLIAEPDDAT